MLLHLLAETTQRAATVNCISQDLQKESEGKGGELTTSAVVGAVNCTILFPIDRPLKKGICSVAILQTTIVEHLRSCVDENLIGVHGVARLGGGCGGMHIDDKKRREGRRREQSRECSK